MAMCTISKDDFSAIAIKLEDFGSKLGLEFYPFKVSWYNSQVKEPFLLQHHPDTLVFCVVSVPCMFEKAFVPYILNSNKESHLDPIDECMENCFACIKADEKLQKYAIEAIHDYEVYSNRRPKLLVQTAGHVSGAAFFYQRCNVANDPWSPEQRIFGVSIHPRYGGWFAFRGALIFRDVHVPFLEHSEPVDVFSGNDTAKIDLLNKFNFNWQDWSFRDIHVAEESYSESLKAYLSAKPGDRHHIIDSIKQSYK